MATPIFCCGCECGVDGPHIVLNPGIVTFTTSNVITGTRSVRCNPSASGNGGAPLGVFVGAGGVSIIRTKIRFDTLPTKDFWVIAHGIAAGVGSGVVYKTADATLYAAANVLATGTVGATGVSVTTGVVYVVEVRIDRRNNPWLVDAQVNRLPVAQASAAVAANTSAAAVQVGLCNFASTITGDATIDDILLSETLGDYPLSGGVVRHFIPTADGTHNIAGTGDFQRTLTGTDILNATTTAFQLVDDVPLESGASVDWINMLAPPNATDYVECIFGPASGVSTPIQPPRAVEVIAGIHQSGTGLGNMEIRLNDNGSLNAVYSATGVAGVTSVAFKRKHYATPPSGGAWTIVTGNGNFNGLRVRFGSPAALDVNPDQFFDCIMIEAEFPDVSPIFPLWHHRPQFQRRRRVI